MIDKDWFVNKVKKSSRRIFSQEEIEKYYDSVCKMIEYSYILRYVDPQTESQVREDYLKMADQQWKILKELRNGKSDIYWDAEDKDLVSEFVDLIQREKEIRDRIPHEKIYSLSEFTRIVNRRAEIYKDVFGYNEKDKKRIREIAQEKARELMEKGPRKWKMIVKLGILGGIVAGGIVGVKAGISYHKNKKLKKGK